ncbi:guanylate-binding protein 2-like isoform X1 [Ruditapes philippinarum]|uniref:guanylate-binding protein 2-like isoform X1 n=1 Tax=Ruditapes philippinarum TaxID=129788 RepID=UPI00295B7078|nr:guanylate-binding protein 2-like isoform X1 [Ruditapes philippinarum]
MTAFNQDTVEKLTFITNMSENLRVSVGDTSDDNFDFVMPDFVLCIRDFTLDLEIDGREITSDQYLEHCLTAKSTGNKVLDEKYNRPRHCIKKYFTKRKAFTFDRPANKKIMKTLDKAKKEDLSPDFIEESQNFQKFIYERTGKMLQTKRPVTVRMLVELLGAYIKAIKDGKVPCIDDALTVMSKEENKKHAKDAIDTFRVDLEKLHLPVGDKTKLLEEKFEIRTSVLKNLTSKLLFDDDHSVEMSVQSEMDRIFKEFETKNDKLLYEKCMKRITDLYEKEVKGNIDGKIYMVSGGYDKYKNDMLRVKEMYETELDHERIDRMQTNKAMRDFLAQRYAESEAIMTEDKSISEDEKNAEMETQKKKLEAEFKETQEKESKRFADELEKQRKQHDDVIAKARKDQEDKDEANRAQFLEEKLAKRDTEILELTKSVARLEGREDERNKKQCSVS